MRANGNGRMKRHISKTASYPAGPILLNILYIIIPLDICGAYVIYSANKMSVYYIYIYILFGLSVVVAFI